MEKKSLIIPWISLYCLLMGMFHNFCWTFGCEVRYGRHVLPFLLISAVTLFCVAQLKRKYAVIASMLGILGLIVFAVIKFEELTSDFLKIVYYLNLRSDEYNGSLLLDFEGIRVAGTAMDFNVFLRFVIIVCAIFISLFVFRIYSRGYGFLPVYGVMSLGLIVGRAPNSKSVTYLVVGAVLALMWIARQERGGRHFFVQKDVKKEFGFVIYFVFAGILLVGVIAAKQIGKKQEADILKDSDKYLAKQHQLERTVDVLAEELSQYIQGKLSGESDGKLDNDEPHYTDSVVIKVTMQQKPSENIYLKGFIGAEYENGEWFPSDNEVFSKIAYDDVKAKDIWNINYLFFSQYFEGFSDELWQSYNTNKSQMWIEYVGRGRFGKYAYVPYFADAHSIVSEDLTDCVTMDGENGMLRNENSYYVTFYTMGEQCYDTVKLQILSDLELIMSADVLSEEYDPSELSDGESVAHSMSADVLSEEYDPSELSAGESVAHSSYVRNAYSRLPNALNTLKRFIWDYEVGFAKGEELVEPVNALKAGQDVAKILAKQASYSMILEPVPEGKDYAEYFLLEQKKGYCEHFATAGTLLLRAKGVPARFVQGYKVTPDMFEENEDGTYTAEILDSNAHAWTEVYEGKYAGWFPIEMTPGYEAGEETTASPSAAPIEAAKPSVNPKENDEVTKAPATKKPTAAPKETKKSGTADESGKTSDGKLNLIRLNLDFDEKYVLFAVGIALLLVCMGRVIYLRCRMRKYRKEFAGEKDKNIQICVRTAQMLHFLRCCGQRNIERQNEDEWCMRASLLCKEKFHPDEWEEFKRIMQKAAFSVSEITEEEFVYYCDMAKEAESYIWQKMGSVRKCYMSILGLSK